MNVSPAQGGNVKIDGNIPSAYPYSSVLATGTKVNLEAISADGYDFAGWGGSLTSQENPTTIDMTCPENITAFFAKEGELTLIMGINGNGSVTPASGYHSYSENTVVNITATPSSGYNFDGWTGDVADPNSASTTVTVDSRKTVIANFSQPTYTLTINMTGGGRISPSTGEHKCAQGSLISITVNPGIGYKFDGWTGDVSDPSSTTVIVTMDSDKSVTANLSLIEETTYALTLEVNGAGSVNMPTGIHLFAKGTVVDIVATPEKGYQFVNWTGDVADPDSASTTVTIDSNKKVTANFSISGNTTTPASSSGRPSATTLGIEIAVALVVIIAGSFWLVNRILKKRANRR